jgi:mono/diheme cytochrome c family protein
MQMSHVQMLIFSLTVAGGIASGVEAASHEHATGAKDCQIFGGGVDEGTYNGFRRYHASCSHCHGPDGMGSTVASSVIAPLADMDRFRQVVRDGVRNGYAVMKGFGSDPNIAPYIDDIYAYLQARADGALPRGRPRNAGAVRRGEKVVSPPRDHDCLRWKR